jgi:sigma-B regulation protein RsbU (phosphoserine phosphatase)
VVKTGTDGQPLLIRTTVFDARDRRSYENELLRARKEAESERVRLQQVLTTLQKSLLPPTLPRIPGLEAAAYYHTASPDELGGDFYDLFALGDGRWGFFLGDVCGKGPEAAAVTSLTRHSLRASFRTHSDPVHALITLDTALHEQYTGNDLRYCTAIAGIVAFEGDDAKLTLASGGHPPALLLRADGTAETVATPGGTLIGALSAPHFASATAVLGPGDTLLLYTDGLTESRTKAGPRYSEDDLHAFARTLAPTGAQATIDALARLLESFGDGLEDDTALLALGMPGPS